MIFSRIFRGSTFIHERTAGVQIYTFHFLIESVALLLKIILTEEQKYSDRDVLTDGGKSTKNTRES
jgi:hypothetical protein